MAGALIVAETATFTNTVSVVANRREDGSETSDVDSATCSLADLGVPDFDPVRHHHTVIEPKPNPGIEPHPNPGIEPEPSCNNLQIPSGHLPPPGSCRIWNPALEPGQQRPPGSCSQLADNVPAGACLVNEYGLVVGNDY